MKSNEICKKDSILIIAAEASSCMYAKKFIDQWSASFPEAEFFGVGDREMQENGMNCLGLAEDMAVVGLLEVVKHYRSIKSVADEILQMSREKRPRFALLLDYPGFNLRIAKELKKLNIPVVYYISPQLWAWKKGRVNQVRDYVDEMLVVFPFEVDFYAKHSIQAHFVGHPLLEVVEAEKSEVKVNSSKRKVLGLMPGSRRSEVQYNFQSQLAAAQILQSQFDLEVRVLLAPTLEESDFKDYLDEGVTVSFVKEKPTEMIQRCDFILSASGTATLQVALCEKPMVVMYRMNSVTAFFAKLLVRSVDSFCIVNLIAGRKVVPELFQKEADAQGLVAALKPLIGDESKRLTMLTDLRIVKEKLGAGGATANVVSFLKKRFYSL